MIRASWSPTTAGQIEQTSKLKQPLATIALAATGSPSSFSISLAFIPQPVPSLPLYISFNFPLSFFSSSDYSTNIETKMLI